MRIARTLIMMLLTAIVFSPVSVAHALEIIQIRTGQVGGVPGVCPGADDVFTYNPINIPQCATPFRTTPFTAADFAAAAAGPPAKVITPVGAWLPALGADPLARWIDWQPSPGSCFGSSNSALYAVRFVVQTACPTAEVNVCWAVDDGLGDVPAWGGPNPVGIYINGLALNPGFSGGAYNAQTCFAQGNVQLNQGVNYMYVYQRDQGCAVAGLLLSARFNVNPGLCPGISVIKFNDMNGDGVQNGSEPGLPGWQINIAGPSTQSQTTGANGQVYFPCLPAGAYTITETPQPGWVQTFPSGGVQTLVIDCGQEYVAYIGNRRCMQSQGCVPLPSCLSAWFPFDECSGTTANEVMANRDGTIMGGTSNPTWGAGSWGSPCGLNFPGLPGTQQVSVPDYPEHDFGLGSFSIVAWVRTQLNDPVVHSILDKRQLPFMTPTGYSLYLYNGIFRFQYGDGSGPYHTHVSTAPPLGDGQWHLVAVTACRNPNNPASNVVRLIVDGYVDTFTGPSIVAGNLSNTAGLTIGDQCPGFIVGNPFGGAIDGVQLYKCCLSPEQVFALHTDLPYCKLNCYVPKVITAHLGSATTTLTLCNYSLSPQTLTWSIAGLPAGPGCSVNGPTVFSPFSGTVTIPPASGGPSCVNIPITIQLPTGMTFGQTACYQVMTQDRETGRCCVTSGRIRRTWPHHVYADPWFTNTPVGTPVPLHFVVVNGGGGPIDLTYRISDQSTDGDPSNQTVSLNGLPPGEPVFGTLSVASRDSAVVVVDAVQTEFQPLNLHEIVFEADIDGDGTPEDLAVCAMESIPEDATSATPDAPPAIGAAPFVSTLTVAPNPFRGATGIRLALAGAQPNVRVEVFDISGRLVRAIFAGSLEAGSHSFSWDGRDESGRVSSSGLYFVRAQSAVGAVETKLIRLQ
jgi:hypothetical protein